MQCKYCKTWRATGGAPSSQFLSNCHQCLVEIHCARACSNCTLYCIGRTMLRRVEACWSSKWPVTRRRQYITPLSKCLLYVVVVFALEWTHSTIHQNTVLIEINFIAIPVQLKCSSLSCRMENSMLGKMGPLLYCSATAPPSLPQLSIVENKSGTVHCSLEPEASKWRKRNLTALLV